MTVSTPSSYKQAVKQDISNWNQIREIMTATGIEPATT